MNDLIAWLVTAACLSEQEKLTRQFAFGLSVLTHDIHDPFIKKARHDLREGIGELMTVYDMVIEEGVYKHGYPDPCENAITILGINMLSTDCAVDILRHEEANEQAQQLQSFH